MTMRRRTLFTMAAVAGTALGSPVRALAQTEATPQGGYAPVNGLEMYYEMHGTGAPLILLHSAFYTIDMWGPFLASLAETHQVIAVEF